MLAPLAAFPLVLLAQDGATDGDAMVDETIDFAQITAAFASELDFETGTVALASGEATFDLPDGWAFLQAKDARRVVEEFWGNPPDTSTIGFLDPPHPDGRLAADYGVIVSLELDGYIEDDDASDIDYADLLDTMQSDTREANEARADAGYETVDIVGWAEPPHYDAATKKLYWAKELRFSSTEETQLNYDVRILGRRGALVLQAVAPMSAFEEVQDGMKTVLAATSFNEGHRYQDFDPSIDKIAAYGIGGLIAGKALAKVGLFAVLAKFGKFIVIGAIALFAGLRRFVFGGGKDENEYAHEEETPQPAE